MSGAEYMIRGSAICDLSPISKTCPSPTRTAYPCWCAISAPSPLVQTCGAGVADWQGEGETVGGIVVMRYGMNALNVIDGVKKKLARNQPSLPPGVEVVPVTIAPG